jgi:hypothetical protein
MRKNNNGIIWTTEADEELKKLVEENPGVSYTKIAKIMTDRFGVTFTKGSCIGRGRRLGIRARKNMVQPRLKKEVMAAITPVVKKRIPGMKLTIYELRDGDCRFPLWPVEKRGGFYCGGPAVNNGSWCKVHRAKVFGNASYRP